MRMKCFRLGCQNEAHVSPIISFSAKAAPEVRAEFKMPLLICLEHAVDDASLYVNDEGWLQIVEAVKKAGRAYPDRDSLQVRYVSIS
jgi:hypothetical protein